MEYGVSSSVAPSDAAFFTVFTAARPAAPVLLSTTAALLVQAEPPSFSPMPRLVTPALPPAGKPLTILICSSP